MTNLIEQLGGYEEARKSLGSLWDVEDNIHLSKKLLEYRREHNIFEVGDYVLRNDGFFSVLKITGIDNGCADLVRRVDGDPRWSRFKLTEIRHATDKEIAQGYRDE
jgi:hypothetical protein